MKNVNGTKHENNKGWMWKGSIYYFVQQHLEPFHFHPVGMLKTWSASMEMYTMGKSKTQACDFVRDCQKYTHIW